MFTKEQRDADIHTLSAVNTKLGVNSDLRFVVTGSWSFEALTQAPLDHEDMDGNVIGSNSSLALERTAELMDGFKKGQGNFKLFKRTGDRLEYDIEDRRLEIQFVEDGTHKIPTATVQLRDSRNEVFDFLVKSLPYTIATWAIRLSGAAIDQKRAVRPTDIEAFKLLLTTKYDLDAVIYAMQDHPQMPKGIQGKEIFKRSLAIAGL